LLYAIAASEILLLIASLLLSRSFLIF